MRAYSYVPPHSTRGRRRPKRHLLLLVLLIAAVIGFLLWRKNKSVPIVSPLIDAVQQEKKPEYNSVEGHYMFSGTVVPARAVDKLANGDFNQPISKFNTFQPEQYDAWEVDVECPVTDTIIPYQTQVSNTVFNCRPEFMKAFNKYFTIANVANNHTEDMGADGYEETVQQLEGAGYQTIGNANPHIKEDICEVIALPVRLKKADNSEVKGTLPIAFCAFHYFSYKPEAGEIETIERYARIMPVFAFMQVGVEYRSSADPDQISIGHKIIDQGPEFLIGNSPHWVQNTEVYKGKLIVYSTGNFMFDQLDAETNRGLSIDISMNAAYDDNMAKWLALGESCKVRHDNCLAEAEKQGLTKVKLTLKYAAVGSSTGYQRVTQRADAALQQAIEERANWQASMKALGQTQ